MLRETKREASKLVNAKFKVSAEALAGQMHGGWVIMGRAAC